LQAQSANHLISKEVMPLEQDVFLNDALRPVQHIADLVDCLVQYNPNEQIRPAR